MLRKRTLVPVGAVMPIRWLHEVRSEDVASVGGKLAAAGLPVPSGFVVTADTYRSFIEETADLFEAVDVPTDNSQRSYGPPSAMAASMYSSTTPRSRPKRRPRTESSSPR